eukprot:2137014-Prymnesium_polylepis.1
MAIVPDDNTSEGALGASALAGTLSASASGVCCAADRAGARARTAGAMRAGAAGRDLLHDMLLRPTVCAAALVYAGW